MLRGDGVRMTLVVVRVRCVDESGCGSLRIEYFFIEFAGVCRVRG